MKRFFIFAVLIICVFCTSCGSVSNVNSVKDNEVANTVENENDIITENNIVENNTEKNTEPIEIVDAEIPIVGNEVVETGPGESIVPIYTSDNLFEYLENTQMGVDFVIESQSFDFYDDFYDRQIDEDIFIRGYDDLGFEVFSISMTVADNEVYDFSVCVNVERDKNFRYYKANVEDMFVRVLLANGIPNEKVTDLVNNFFYFDTYSANEYGNLERYFAIENKLGLGVIFDGGKDFEFNGTSYYFVMMNDF